MVNPEIIISIVQATNAYAASTAAPNFKPLTIGEFFIYLGVISEARLLGSDRFTSTMMADDVTQSSPSIGSTLLHDTFN